MVTKMMVTIPTMFTDRFINNEIARLDDFISSCDSNIARLTEKIQREKGLYDWAINGYQSAYQRHLAIVSDPSLYNLQEMSDVKFYANLMEEAGEQKRMTMAEIKRYERQKEDYEKQKREFKTLLSKTEAQRAEEHYQRLLKAKGVATTEEENQDLAKQFRKMDGYKDANELAIYCDSQSHKIRERNTEEQYQRLLKAKRKASTEKDYQDLAEHFRGMNDYKDAAYLAMDCDAESCNIKWRIKEQERSVRYSQIDWAINAALTEEACQDIAKRIRELGDDKNATELACECDNKLREFKRRREEQERLKAKEKSNRVFWGVALGGMVGGGIFALLSVLTKGNIPSNNISSVVAVFAIATGILGFIVGDAGNDGCSYGCLGLIIGAIGSLLLVAIFSATETIVAIGIGVVLGMLIGGWRGSK